VRLGDANDPPGDLPAIGDEQLSEQRPSDAPRFVFREVDQPNNPIEVRKAWRNPAARFRGLVFRERLFF
jgi:hypothetical protein